MATFENAGLINTPNINSNNNNNNLDSSLTTPLSRDSYNQHLNSKSSSSMSKDQIQNFATTKQDYVVSENDNTQTTPSTMDSTPKTTDSPKRNNTNGKFSIQKIIRQGFSSWRTKKKPPPPPPPPPPSISSPLPSTLSTNISTPSSPPASTGRYVISDVDLSQINPSTTSIRSSSVDVNTNQTPPQRIIVTEQISAPSNRSNNIDSAINDSDAPAKVNRGYIQSPWAKSIGLTTNNIESTASRVEPLSSNRMLNMQFIDNTKLPTSINLPSIIEVANSTMSSSNISKIPPPGIYRFIVFDP